MPTAQQLGCPRLYTTVYHLDLPTRCGRVDDQRRSSGAGTDLCHGIDRTGRKYWMMGAFGSVR